MWAAGDVASAVHRTVGVFGTTCIVVHRRASIGAFGVPPKEVQIYHALEVMGLADIWFKEW